MESYFSQHTKRFFFLCGRSDDQFCLPTLEVVDLQEALCRHLRQLGYRRVIYYDGRRKIHFPDAEAKALAQGRPPAAAEPAAPAADRPPGSTIAAGPLGGRRLRRSKAQAPPPPAADQQPATPNPAAEPLHFGRMSDSDAASALDRLMKDSACPTAIVFSNGLDFLLSFDPEAERQMAGCLEDWNRLPAQNRSVALFILSLNNVADLGEIKDRVPHWQLLWSKLLTDSAGTLAPGPGVVSISSPGSDEVSYLIHRYRLLEGRAVDWAALPDAAPRIARRLAAVETDQDRQAGVSKPDNLKELDVAMGPHSRFSAHDFDRLGGVRETVPALERLKGLQGLEAVTERVEKLIHQYREQRQFAGQHDTPPPDPVTPDRLRPLPPPPVADLNLHMVLMGNPGTGKTTAARLIGEIFRDAGLLPSGHFVEVQREDLVAGYIGQTALRTAQRVQDALGGVLFVDEAYRLTEGGENDFGREAVETLMRAMNDHRGRLAVIVAGYPGRMEQFVQANPGLRRRFSPQNFLTIPDYGPELLAAIFRRHMTRCQPPRHLDDALNQRLDGFFHRWYQAREVETFGNAGDVLNLFTALDENRASRMIGQPDGPRRWTLTLEDVPADCRRHLEAGETTNESE